jgi:DNA polymerase
MRLQYPNNVCDCALCETRSVAKQVVPGFGNPNADIMIIGQNPGREEDAQGKPFVGKSGDWLDRILKSICHKREEVFITNTVKCLTPNNRLPEPQEIEKCAYWLIQDVKAVNPSLIIPLGACALQAVTCAPPDTRITEYAGRTINSPVEVFKDKLIFPLMHPATLAYNFSRNYPPYCTHVANLFALLIELGILEPSSENWRDDFKF